MNLFKLSLSFTTSWVINLKFSNKCIFKTRLLCKLSNVLSKTLTSWTARITSGCHCAPVMWCSSTPSKVGLWLVIWNTSRHPSRASPTPLHHLHRQTVNRSSHHSLWLIVEVVGQKSTIWFCYPCAINPFPPTYRVSLLTLRPLTIYTRRMTSIGKLFFFPQRHPNIKM